eukprot:1272507-Prorocentrum_lima.AAC.1
MFVELAKARLPNGAIFSLPFAICDRPPAAAQPVAPQDVTAIALALAEQAPPEVKSIGPLIENHVFFKVA